MSDNLGPELPTAYKVILRQQEEARTGMVQLGETLCDKALAGEVRAAAILSVNPDGSLSIGWAGFASPIEVVGALAVLHEKLRKQLTV